MAGDSWVVKDNRLSSQELLKNESIFNVANGYIGVRGNFEEKYPSNLQSIRGTYINAFYETVPITYGEKAYAFPETMQKIVNVIDAQSISVIVNGERFSLFEGTVKDFKRYLNMKEGYYCREIWWISPKGKELKIKITRLTSFSQLELFAIRYEIQKLNFDDEVIIESELNGAVKNYTDKNDPRLGGAHSDILTIENVSVNEDIIQIQGKTHNSNKVVVVTTKHKCNGDYSLNIKSSIDSVKAEFKIKHGTDKIEFVKYNIYTDSRRHINPSVMGLEILNKTFDKSFNIILIEQKEYLDKFWSIADIEIEGREELKQGLRYNLYQLIQSVGKDSLSNITAKGLSGEGYEGHYFWDTEIYILPFFTLCNPALAKQLLKYRYNILDSARKRAKELGHKKGAAYPWRTITGEECSAYFPAGTAQYHINGDIAYSYIQYYLATGDELFLKEFGAEVIFETARIWLEIGHFYKEEFRIDAVTGPDEYTAVVNNNYYTNLLAKYNLKWAVKIYNKLKESDLEHLNFLCREINLKEEEINLFDKAEKKMYMPYDKELKIYAQDDSFLSKAVWDFQNTPKENYPLLLHYHPLTIYRYQVLKQADTVLANLLVEDEAEFEIIKNSYDYYEKITTHDSSLSYAAYSIMSARVGYLEKAYKYFIETARLDLDNIHGNTKDGIHTANMGGTWMAVVYGFAGLRIKEEYISLRPNLPKSWEELKFKFIYKGSIVKVDMNREKTIISVKADKEISIKINEQLYRISKNENIEIKN